MRHQNFVIDRVLALPDPIGLEFDRRFFPLPNFVLVRIVLSHFTSAN